MAPIQILVNNLLYDFSQLGIPSDNVDEEYLLTPRKWNIVNVRRFMIYIGPISSIFDYATFFVMLYFYKCILFTHAGGANDKYCEQLFHTGWFVESILTQTLIVHIIRTRKIPFIQSRASPILIFTTLLIMGIGSFIPYYPPLANYLGMVPLPATFWLWIAAFLLGYAVLTHYVKSWYFNRFGVD
jgi:Mg2+-importing ATPase